MKGAAVYDDYAHHPGELQALLETAAKLDYKRVICAFQPHTYSRTKALFSEFAEVLQHADVTYLAEIYAAREKNEIGIYSKDLAAAIPAKAAENFAQLTDWLYDQARPGGSHPHRGRGRHLHRGVRRGQKEANWRRKPAGEGALTPPGAAIKLPANCLGRFEEDKIWRQCNYTRSPAFPSGRSGPGRRHNCTVILCPPGAVTG